jgi:hypothetical protein
MAPPFNPVSFNPIVRVPWLGRPQKFRIQSAAGTNATLVVGTPATLEAIILANKNAAARYVHFYDVVAAPTAGAGTVDWTLQLPPSLGPVTIPMGVAIPYFTGLGFTITGAEADNDATAISAGDIDGVLIFSGSN